MNCFFLRNRTHINAVCLMLNSNKKMLHFIILFLIIEIQRTADMVVKQSYQDQNVEESSHTSGP